MIRNGEFQVSASDIVKIKCLEQGLPLHEQDVLKKDGEVVYDPKLDAVGLGTFTAPDGAKIGEPTFLALQEQAIGVAWTNGCARANLIARSQAPVEDGRIHPVPPTITAGGSASLTLSSSTATGWKKVGDTVEFAATAAGITVGSIALPTDPTSSTSETVAGTWALFPSTGVARTDASGTLHATVHCVFTPTDEKKYAPIDVEVEIPSGAITDSRLVGVVPVESKAQVDDANTNKIAVAGLEKTSMGLTCTGTKTSATSSAATQKVTATAGTLVDVTEAEIQALGYTSLTGTRNLVGVMLDVPSNATQIQVVDTVSGGIGMALTKTYDVCKLVEDSSTHEKHLEINVINGNTYVLITPVQETNNESVARTIKMLDASGAVLFTHTLTIDVSALYS